MNRIWAPCSRHCPSLVLPRLECVWQADVDEALRLMQMSKYSLHDDESKAHKTEDPIIAIYGKIRGAILREQKQIYTWEEVTQLCSTFTVSFELMSSLPPRLSVVAQLHFSGA